MDAKRTRMPTGGRHYAAKASAIGARQSIVRREKDSAAASLLVSGVSHLSAIGGALLAIAVVLGSVLPLSWPFGLAAAACYGIVVALVLTGLPRHAPHRRFGLANATTLTRALLTALLWGVIAELLFGDVLVLDTHVRWLLGVAATVALLSDGVDGWAARRYGTATDFGAHFDMEVDSLFLLALSMLVFATGEVGAWVIASGSLRYAFVLSGYRWPQLAKPLLPLWRRKVVCVLQFTVLIIALIPILPAAAAQTLCLGGLALLCYSFAADLVWLVSPSRAKPEASRMSRRASGPIRLAHP